MSSYQEKNFKTYLKKKKKFEETEQASEQDSDMAGMLALSA